MFLFVFMRGRVLEEVVEEVEGAWEVVEVAVELVFEAESGDASEFGAWFEAAFEEVSSEDEGLGG